MTTPDTGPYKGLAPFGDSDLDALLFFGRARERRILLANLLGARLTVLYGPSGAGKTSLVRAGVAHELRALDGPGRRAVVVLDAWSGDPVEALKAQAAAALGPVDGVPEKRLAAASLADALELRAGVARKHLVVVLDQLEEYFLYHDGETGPGSFVAELAEAVRRPELHASFLLSIREDALARLDVFKPSIPNLFANSLRLDRLDRDAGREAIVGPLAEWSRFASAAAVTAEDGLVEAVLDGVAVASGPDGAANGRRRVEAPYLQLVMSRVWEAERAEASERLRLETLQRLGGARHLVEEHLERALAPLSEAEQQAAAAMFEHLVTPSGSKIAQALGDLATYAGIDDTDAASVVGDLVERRVLRPAEANGGGPRYEIFHDVLGEPVVAWRRRRAVERALAEERAAAQRRHRRLLIVAVAACAGLALMAAVAVFALTQRARARTDARQADARALAAQAYTDLTLDPQRGLADALRATELEPSPQMANVLRQTLVASPLRAVLRSGKPFTAAAFAPDGSRLLVAGGRFVRVFDGAGQRQLLALRDPAHVTVATFGPGGRTILTGDSAGSARLWATASGRLLASMRERGPIVAASFSSDGLLLLAGRTSATIRRAGDGGIVRRLPVSGRVRGATLSPDGRLAAVWAADAAGHVRASIFDVATSSLRHVLPELGILDAEFSPRSSLLATGSADRTARIWDALNGTQIHAFQLKGHVVALRFSPLGYRLATASEDGSGALWRVPDGPRQLLFSDATNYVESAAFSADGRFLVFGSLDRAARVYNSGDGRLRSVLTGHREGVTSAVFGPEGRQVLTGSLDGTARLWDSGVGDQLRVLGRQPPAVRSAVFGAGGRLALSVGADATARLWHVRVHRPPVVLRPPHGATSASFGPDGRRVVTAGRGGATVWSVEGQRLLTLRPSSPLVAAVYDPTGKLIAGAGADGRARVWDAVSGRLVATVSHGRPLDGLAFSPDGRLLATVGGRNLRIWQARGGAVRSMRAGAPSVRASWSPDGRLLLAAAVDGGARLWDPTNGRLLHVLRADGSALTDAEFSRDGRRIVTTGENNDANTWDVASGRHLRTLRGHFNTVNAASFSPDGRWIVTAGPVTAGLWDADAGNLIAFLRGPQAALTSASFAPDGRTILASSLDGTVRTYDCAVCGPLPSLMDLAHARLAAAAPR